MDGNDEASSLLLQLPDPWLLAVLRCCAEDPRSLFSAARAHSRLHQAAVLAASSITAIVSCQQQADSVLQYLRIHGQHVNSLAIQSVAETGMVTLFQLPHSTLQGLSSLSLDNLVIDLQRGLGRNLLASWPGLNQLQLHNCQLDDEYFGLQGALLQLPKLQHLSLCFHPDTLYDTLYYERRSLEIPSSALQALKQLTYLELENGRFEDRHVDSLQPLQGLTNLQDLRLDIVNTRIIRASALLGFQHLTCLKVSSLGSCKFEPGALAGKTLLQHLEVVVFHHDHGDPTELLSHLACLQQLTYLQLQGTIQSWMRAEVTAYSALTACSRLQHLDISQNVLPAGVWQHVFPAGRQLPHLRALDISSVIGPKAAPEGSRLVSCCPGLRSLMMNHLQYTAEALAPLSGLSGLHELRLTFCDSQQSEPSMFEVLEAVGQLTGLMQLTIWNVYPRTALHSAHTQLMQLTQLKQLTYLEFGYSNDYSRKFIQVRWLSACISHNYWSYRSWIPNICCSCC
jgi:hypothetical protein